MRPDIHAVLAGTVCVVILLSCAGPPTAKPPPPPETTGIPSPAPIQDPEIVLRVYDIRDLVSPIRDYAGEEINLTPSMRLSQFIAPNLILRPAGSDFDEDQPQFGTAREGEVIRDLRSVSIRRSAIRKSAPVSRASERARRQSTLVPNTSRLRVGEKEDLPLRALQATVRIHGFRARVLLDAVYENDRDRQLEGNFQVRLPDGASPWYVAFGEAIWTERAFAAAETAALDLTLASVRAARDRAWSGVREARMVPRERAARAYGATVRRRVDPALLEWEGAGVFRARVFPLVPGKHHRIVIGYDVDLRAVGEDLEFRLDLPRTVPELVVDLVVEDAEAVVTPAVEPVNGHHRFHDPETETIRVRLPRPGNLLLHGDDPETGPYFAARLRPAVTVAPARPAARAVFLLDVSLGAGPGRFDIDLDLLEAILERNRPDLREFAVLFFDVQFDWWRTGFETNTPERVREFLDHAGGLLLEGATDLGGALDEVARAFPAGSAEPFDLFLLSDGAATWGEQDAGAFLASLHASSVRSLFAYDPGTTGTDCRTLARLARATEGEVFTVAGEDEVPTAARAHLRKPWRIRNVTIEGGSDLLLADDRSTLVPGQTLTLVGRGRPEGDSVRLTLEQDGREEHVRVPIDRVLESELAPRAYGEVALARLEALGPVAAEMARPYSSHFRVVGSTCSLLMLESEADYERFEIRSQDDAAAIRGAAVLMFLAEHEAGAREALGSPRAAFLAWIEALERALDARVDLPPEVRAPGLPEAAFRVARERLGGRVRRAGDVPVDFERALAETDLDHAVVAAEARRRREIGGSGDALRSLSSLVERRPGEPALRLDLGDRALEDELPGQAYHLFARMARRQPFAPAGPLGLARAAAASGKWDLAMLVYEVVLGTPWDGRFGDIRRIAMLEYVEVLRRVVTTGTSIVAPGRARERLTELVAELGFDTADLVVTMSWTTDRTDVDLHVVDPTGEECRYDHRDTKIGGHLTADVTSGYGPEMFVLRKSVPGTYSIAVRSYATDRLRASTRTRALVTVREDWGGADERVTRLTVIPPASGEMRRVATIER